MIYVSDIATIRKAELKHENNNDINNLRSRAEVSIREAFCDLFPNIKNKKITIVLGKGYNASDCFDIIYYLKETQDENFYRNIKIVSLFSMDEIERAGKIPIEKFKNIQSQVVYGVDNIDGDIIIDGIVGIGLNNTPRGVVKEAIEKINSLNAIVVSIDIPSGLNADNGQAEFAIKANYTIAIQSYKQGYILNDGKDHCGIIIVKDVKMNIDYEDIGIIEEQDIRECFKKRDFNSNKGTFGRVSVIGSCDTYIGACKLANLGLNSIRSGAGMNTLAIPSSSMKYLGNYILESTVFQLSSENGHIRFDSDELDQLISFSKVIVIGMGLGDCFEENSKILQYLLKKFKGNLIIDADAINTIAKVGIDLNNCECNVILTPHPKEMQRLIGKRIDIILNDPIVFSKRLAKKYNCTVLLKGASSIITDGNKVRITSNGGPCQSKGGSGDVLAGVIAGISATNDLLISACAASFLCAKACNNLVSEYSEYGVLPSQVAREIANLIKN